MVEKIANDQGGYVGEWSENAIDGTGPCLSRSVFDPEVEEEAARQLTFPGG